MELMDAIYHRRAIREFTDEAIGRDTIEKLIEAAIQAPSAMNLQPWAFVVVRDRAALARMSRQAKAHLLKTIAKGSPLDRFRESLADPGFDIFYGAPALVAICARPVDGEPVVHETGDCGLAAQNLMLAAHGMGLGTCWIGLSQPWLDTPDGKAELGIPGTYTVVAPLILGQPKSFPPSHGRKKAEVFWRGE